MEQVLVHPLPIPAFSYTTPNCLGAPVQYTNQSTTVPGYMGSIVRWTWNFGDGSPLVIINFPGNPSVSHIFIGGALAHTVTLTVKTSDSCSASISHIVNSMPSPLASFSFPTSDCAQQSVCFTDNSQANGGGNITQWYWDFGDPASGNLNNSTAQNPCHTFNASGNYTVKEIVYNASNCTDTATQTVTIIAHPTAAFHADTVCFGSLTIFTDQSTAVGTITQWHWQFGDGQTSNVKNPTHQYANSGVFNVTLTVTTSEGCSNSITKPVLVLGDPVASFTTSAPSCAKDTVHFTNLSTTPHGLIHTWIWNFGDGSPLFTVNLPGNPNVGHYYTTGGTYNVTLKIITSDNCSDSVTSPVQIDFAPAANFSFATTRCTMEPVQFTDLSQLNGGTPINQWLWTFG